MTPVIELDWKMKRQIECKSASQQGILPAQGENVNLENTILVKDNEVLSRGEHAVFLTCRSLENPILRSRSHCCNLLHSFKMARGASLTTDRSPVSNTSATKVQNSDGTCSRQSRKNFNARGTASLAMLLFSGRSPLTLLEA
ncbi:hypothetical protein EUGRSUZ_H02742 [Eucalyptus grandis]|uniref:Uncharacterized protein n=2 Tax=Eucalyptus grandis TaxID=71139 RepID=A0ACC3JSK8_EUCGR|nr:hypothetical protein EUGRSUZ_H02742 [Eucalyptus grandis]